MEAAVETGDPYESEYRIVVRWRIRWFHVRFSPCGRGKRIIRWYTLRTDMTSATSE